MEYKFYVLFFLSQLNREERKKLRKKKRIKLKR
jgi:hypothetical protein